MYNSTLKAAIQAAINTPADPKISGSILQQKLLEIISAIDAGAVFKGVATPASSPSGESNCFYLASTEGTYTNFLDINGNAIVLAEGKVALLASIYNNDVLRWTKNLVPGRGENSYLHIMYAATEPTQDSDMHDTFTSGDKWIGICADANDTAPDKYDAYQWAKFVGDNGAPGADGHNPNLGTYLLDTTTEPPYPIDAPATAQDGDYIVVIDESQQPSTQRKWIWDSSLNSGAGGWKATTVDPGAQFQTGEYVAATGIDNEPIAGSDNLVKSGGIRKISNLNIEGICSSEEIINSLILDTEETLSLTWNQNCLVDYKGSINSGALYSNYQQIDIQLSSGYLYDINIRNAGSNSWYGLTVLDGSNNLLFNHNKGLDKKFIFPSTATTLRLCSTVSAQYPPIIKRRQIILPQTVIDRLDSEIGQLTLKTTSVAYTGENKTIFSKDGIDFKSVGEYNETNGYYDKDGVFQENSDYRCKEYTINPNCVYEIHSKRYGSVAPPFIALDENNNVLFSLSQDVSKYMKFSSQVKKIRGSSYKTWYTEFYELDSNPNFVSALKTKLQNKNGNNVFDKSTAISGFTFNSGIIVTDSNYSGHCLNEFYNLNGETNLCVTLENYNNCKLSLYDNKNEFIRQEAVSNSNAIDITGAYRLALVCPKSQDIMVNFGSIALPYEPYYEYYDIKVSDSQHADVADTLSDTGFLNPLISSLQKPSLSITSPSLTNDVLTLTNYPKYVKKSHTIVLDCKITSFNSLSIGTGQGNSSGGKITITADRIYFQKGNHTGIQAWTSIEHGLTIETFLKVAYVEYYDEDGVGNLDYIVSTLGGYFKGNYHGEGGDIYNNAMGQPFVSSNDSDTVLTDVSLRASSPDFQHPIWVVGDSYTSVFTVRWPWYILKDFKIINWLLQGLAGGHSSQMYEDLQKSLALGTPKYLVWCLGMNNADSDSLTPNSSWLETVNNLITLCNANNITLILSTVPCVPERNNEAKNSWVRNSGYRYVDFAKAVHGETYTAGVDNWYEGYLNHGTEQSPDNVHPTELGAKALATQLLADFPEIMQCS